PTAPSTRLGAHRPFPTASAVHWAPTAAESAAPHRAARGGRPSMRSAAAVGTAQITNVAPSPRQSGAAIARGRPSYKRSAAWREITIWIGPATSIATANAVLTRTPASARSDGPAAVSAESDASTAVVRTHGSVITAAPVAYAAAAPATPP